MAQLSSTDEATEKGSESSQTIYKVCYNASMIIEDNIDET
jgi:hypothetical protein